MSFFKTRYKINSIEIEDIYAGRNIEEVKSFIKREYADAGPHMLTKVLPGLNYAGKLDDILDEIHEDDLYSGYKSLLSGIPCLIGASKHSNEEAILQYL